MALAMIYPETDDKGGRGKKAFSDETVSRARLSSGPGSAARLHRGCRSRIVTRIRRGTLADADCGDNREHHQGDGQRTEQRRAAIAQARRVLAVCWAPSPDRRHRTCAHPLQRISDLISEGIALLHAQLDLRQEIELLRNAPAKIFAAL